MAEHMVIKPEKLAAAAAVALEESLVVPAIFDRKGIEEYKGAKDDAVNVKVEGVLPYRTYGWRNDRSTDIQFDEYKERTVQHKFGDDIYSGVLLTDEQNMMDFDGWTKLAGKQVEAIGRGLEYKATKALEAAPFEVEVQLDEANIRRSLIQLKTIFDKLRVPGERTLLINDDLEIALLDDEKLNLASNVGEAEAVSALREATIGRKYKFNFVKADELGADSVAVTNGGFVFLTAAPDVPQSVPFGAVASHNGVAIQWLRDYDFLKRRDRSVFFAYQGFNYVDDVLIGTNEATGQAFVSEENHFVRGVKVTLGTGFNVEVGNAELAAITGITDTDGLTPTP